MTDLQIELQFLVVMNQFNLNLNFINSIVIQTAICIYLSFIASCYALSYMVLSFSFVLRQKNLTGIPYHPFDLPVSNPMMIVTEYPPSGPLWASTY